MATSVAIVMFSSGHFDVVVLADHIVYCFYYSLSTWDCTKVWVYVLQSLLRRDVVVPSVGFLFVLVLGVWPQVVDGLDPLPT